MIRASILATAIAAVLGFMAGRGCSQPETTADTYAMNTDTVRMVRIDTVTVTTPAAKQARVRDTMILRVDSGSAIISPTADSIIVRLPREEKVYADSLYRAVVSGVDVSLDTITVWPRMETVTILPKRDDKRWIIGPSAGLMWDGRKLSPAIGVSITYRFAAF